MSASSKAEDWKRVQTEHPNHAQFITDFAAVFGKPAEVRVKTVNGELILDTRRYKNKR